MKYVLLALPMLVLAGCGIGAQSRTAGPPSTAAVVTHKGAAPLAMVVMPDSIPEGGDVVEVEPDFDLREYVSAPGYPPGCYLSGGFYYYGDRRFDYEDFHQYAERNLRQHRFENAGTNRKEAERQEEKQRNSTTVPPRHRRYVRHC